MASFKTRSYLSPLWKVWLKLSSKKLIWYASTGILGRKLIRSAKKCCISVAVYAPYELGKLLVEVTERSKEPPPFKKRQRKKLTPCQEGEVRVTSHMCWTVHTGQTNQCINQWLRKRRGLQITVPWVFWQVTCVFEASLPIWEIEHPNSGDVWNSDRQIFEF